MRAFLAGLILSIAFLSQSASTAQAQCVLCGAVGFAMGSATADGENQNASGGRVYYQAPNIAERINNPLDVKFVAYEGFFSYGNYGQYSLSELFSYALGKERDNVAQYEVLEVTLNKDVGAAERAVIWFVYIEKAKLKPLSAQTTN